MSDKVKIRQIADIDAALVAYYRTVYINNEQIGRIFGTTARSSIWQLKKPVIEEEQRRELPVVVPHCINARVAFEVWAERKELERIGSKLQALGL
jgi:hypothetical protein